MCSTVITASASTLHACCACSICGAPLHCRFWKKPVTALRTGLNDAAMTSFLRPSSPKWHRHLRAQRAGDARLWEIAVLFHLRDAFRSGDVRLTRSRRYGDLKHDCSGTSHRGRRSSLLRHCGRRNGLAIRKLASHAVARVGRAARAGTIPAVD